MQDNDQSAEIAAVLIAGPRIPLPIGYAETLAERWRSRTLTWLDWGKAAEITVPREPTDYLEVREQTHSLGCDLVLVPARNRRKRLLVADMDSTIIEQECIDELASAAGLNEKVAAITQRAMNGELEFSDALRERTTLLRGLNAKTLDKVWRDRITLTAGASELVATMRANGGEAVLISGGFTAFTSKVAATAGFSRHFANELLTEGGRLSGAVREPIVGQNAKREIFAMLLAEGGLSADESIAVGDGANDIRMLRAAGLGVAFHAKPVVNAQIRIQIRHADLTALLFLQGYRREEFAD